jgi:hypothetical protein
MFLVSLNNLEQVTDDTNAISSDQQRGLPVSRPKVISHSFLYNSTHINRIIQDQPQELQNSVVDENTGIELRDLKPSPTLEPYSGGPSPSWGSPLNGSNNGAGSPSWSSWLGDGYVSVKSYVLNCFYSWMPSEYKLFSYKDTELSIILCTIENIL